jgi:hypothetical protein
MIFVLLQNIFFHNVNVLSKVNMILFFLLHWVKIWILKLILLLILNQTKSNSSSNSDLMCFFFIELQKKRYKLLKAQISCSFKRLKSVQWNFNRDFSTRFHAFFLVVVKRRKAAKQKNKRKISFDFRKRFAVLTKFTIFKSLSNTSKIAVTIKSTIRQLSMLLFIINFAGVYWSLK